SCAPEEEVSRSDELNDESKAGISLELGVSSSSDDRTPCTGPAARSLRWLRPLLPPELGAEPGSSAGSTMPLALGALRLAADSSGGRANPSCADRSGGSGWAG